MSRKGMEFVDDLKVIARVDLVRRKDAVFTVDFEDGDRDHQVAGKLEGVGLCKRKIVRHVRGSILERANSRSMAPRRLRDGRDHRDGEAEVAVALRRTPCGFIVGSPDLGQGAMDRKRDWLAHELGFCRRCLILTRRSTIPLMAVRQVSTVSPRTRTPGDRNSPGGISTEKSAAGLQVGCLSRRRPVHRQTKLPPRRAGSRFTCIPLSVDYATLELA